MSALTALARALAIERGRAVLTVTRRHTHISDRPLVFVPLALAGEANAPLACLIGSTLTSPQLLVVPQPRNRDLRFAFTEALARVMLDYVESFTASMEILGDDPVFSDAPQLIVANPSVVAFTRLLGRSTRLRRTDGDYAVHPSVPMLGRWLTFFAERAEHPGSAAMISMTSALAAHWATGQSALEDANLAALMGWINPPPGVCGFDAAADAEDPLRWPPAGPATDPSFDNDVLAPLVRVYDDADANADDGARDRAVAALESALRGQMEATWLLVWQGVALLRTLPPAGSIARRWEQERREFTDRMEYWRDGGLPQGRLDQAVAAARRLNQLEREQEEFVIARALDDQLALAEFRLTGEAFTGTVVHREPTRVDRSGKRAKLRPQVVVATSDPVRLDVGTALRSPARPTQEARVVDVCPVDFGCEVTLELSGGMGRTLTPPPGAVPELAETLSFSTLTMGAGRSAPFPHADDTPWTHGGPPRPYAPTDADAAEAWA